jgi:hypothetical protein
VVPTRTIRIDIAMAQTAESRVFYRPRGPDGQAAQLFYTEQLFYTDGIVS